MVRCFIVRSLASGIAGVFVAVGAAHAATPLAAYNYAMSDFVENAAGTAIYATVPAQNSIAIINPTTLQMTLVGIGSNPTGLALSHDGSKLYVANNGSNFLGVLNTQNNSVLSPISLGSGVYPLDVQAGNNGRLWVLTGEPNQFDSIIQVDAATGASTGSGAGAFTYGGKIRTNADGTRLYYGDFGTSPAYEYQFDVSGNTATTLWSGSLGSNGSDVALSRDGTLMGFPTVSPANSIMRTSDALALGSVGPTQSMDFSPDDAYVYTAISSLLGIRPYSTTTFLQDGTIDTVGGIENIFIDNTGGLVFSNELAATRVYATGHAVPEPASLALLAGSAALLLGRRKSRRRAVSNTSM